MIYQPGDFVRYVSDLNGTHDGEVLDPIRTYECSPLWFGYTIRTTTGLEFRTLGYQLTPLKRPGAKHG